MDALIINMALSILFTTVKNPNRKEEMRKAFKKMYKTILSVYPEFATEE